MRWCRAVHGALVPERCRARLWTVLEFRRDGKICRASIILRGQFYILLVELPGTREEEESRSNNQEQEDIDGTGEVEH